MSHGISAEPPFRFCALCGDELEGALDRDTGICQTCSDVRDDDRGEYCGEWLGSLDGLTVRVAGEDAGGPVLQIDGTDGMAAVEMDTPLSINGLEIAASELRSVYLAADSEAKK